MRGFGMLIEYFNPTEVLSQLKGLLFWDTLQTPEEL